MLLLTTVLTASKQEVFRLVVFMLLWHHDDNRNESLPPWKNTALFPILRVTVCLPVPSFMPIWSTVKVEWGWFVFTLGESSSLPELKETVHTTSILRALKKLSVGLCTKLQQESYVHTLSRSSKTTFAWGTSRMQLGVKPAGGGIYTSLRDSVSNSTTFPVSREAEISFFMEKSSLITSKTDKKAYFIKSLAFLACFVLFFLWTAKMGKVTCLLPFICGHKKVF